MHNHWYPQSRFITKMRLSSGGLFGVTKLFSNSFSSDKTTSPTEIRGGLSASWLALTVEVVMITAVCLIYWISVVIVAVELCYGI